MTFVCDAIIKVSFKELLLHMYVLGLLEVWHSRMRLCYKLYNAHSDTPDIKPESKRQSIVNVDRLARLLPFACPFKSSDLKAWLL